MRLLRDILYKAGIDAIHGDSQLAITGVSQDSRAVKRFGLYVAIKGTRVDGHDFIDAAIRNGAVAIVCELIPEVKTEGVTYVQVSNSQKALGQIAANYFDHPSQKLKLIGVTGTNGKTSVATGLYDLYTKMGYRCGLISTVENRIGSLVTDATHTTPDAVNLQATLARMVEARVSYCFMEVSSHALDQERIAGTRFVGGIFTNISHDHLDYHKTFNNYIAAKKRLFDSLPADAFALYNSDDRQGEVMVSASKARTSSYSMKKVSDIKGRLVENSLHGLVMEIDGVEVATMFTGAFNAYNLLAIYGTACLLGQDRMHVLTTLSTLSPPRGRFQKVGAGKDFPLGIVDYAHTPDALENVLKTLRDCMEGNSRLFCVVGCGGNRDKQKRPLMGQIAARYADQSIFTSDNPREESAEDIIQQMKSDLTRMELKKVLTVSDRAEAIRLAFQLARPGDAVLVAGKGHETYQEISNTRLPFDDAQHIREALDLLTSKNP